MSSAPLRVLVLNGPSTAAPDVAALIAATIDCANFHTVTRSIGVLRVIASGTHVDDRRRAATTAAAEADVVVISLNDETVKLNEAAVNSSIELLADVGIPVVLMLGFGDESESEFAAAANWLSLHVRGAISIDAGAGEIIATIRAAVAGLVVIEPRIADALLRGALRSPRSRAKALRAPGEALPLSAREREVLALLAHGHATKNIAHLLGISSHTVKAHVESIFAKFGATTRAEAVAIGVRRGAVML